MRNLFRTGALALVCISAAALGGCDAPNASTVANDISLACVVGQYGASTVVQATVNRNDFNQKAQLGAAGLNALCQIATGVAGAVAAKSTTTVAKT